MKLLIEADVSAAADRQQAIADRVGNPRMMLTLLGGLLSDYEREVFATRGHGRWAALDPATVRAKNSGRVLISTGGLLRHLTDARIEGESVKIDQGSSVQAQWLKGGARGTPRRDPAPAPTRRDVQDWARQLLGYVVDGRQ